MLWQLFLAFLEIGALSFGGGYASLPLLRQVLTVQHAWLTAESFTNIVTISQMTPGPVAINAATFVGMQMAGFPGMVMATIGATLPGVTVVSVLAIIWNKYGNVKWMQAILEVLRPVTVGLIVAAAVDLVLPITGNLFLIGLGLLDFWLLAKKDWNPILVMVLSGLAYVLFLRI